LATTDPTVGENALLRCLAENSVEVKAPKGVGELLFQALGENLQDPQDEPKKWANLFTGTRTLERCFRLPMWELMTSAYSASGALYKSWIFRPQELAKTAASDSSKVRTRWLFCGFISFSAFTS
jgi:hypothetical protein